MHDLSTFFRALADRKRLRIVEYLAENEHVPVTRIGVELRMSQPLMSWHLRILRRAGIVKTRRAGRQVFCSINRVALADYQRQIDEAFKIGQARVQHDEQPPVSVAAHQS